MARRFANPETPSSSGSVSTPANAALDERARNPAQLREERLGQQHADEAGHQDEADAPDRGSPRGPPHADPRLGAVVVGDLDDQILTHREMGRRKAAPA